MQKAPPYFFDQSCMITAKKAVANEIIMSAVFTALNCISTGVKKHATKQQKEHSNKSEETKLYGFEIRTFFKIFNNNIKFTLFILFRPKKYGWSMITVKYTE